MKEILQVQTERQEFQSVEELYEKAMEIDSSNASVYVHRGLLLLQWKGDIENAVQLMRQAIKLDEKCEFAYETLGTVEVQRLVIIFLVTYLQGEIFYKIFCIELFHYLLKNRINQ